MSSELATIEHSTPTPAQLMRQASDVAGLCKAIVTKTAKKIGDRKYVPIEGWQAVATAHGCMLSINLVEDIGDGIRAVAEVKRMENGAVLATAEGFVGHQEHPWSKRELYARRAMAQTRAMSRAARSAFAHVVVLMDAGLETTPAEEMSAEVSTTEIKPVLQPERRSAQQSAAPAAAAPDGVTGELCTQVVEVPGVPTIKDGIVQSGKNKGKPWKRWAYQSATAGCWLGTFDHNVGALIEEAAEQNFALRIDFDRTANGGDILQAMKAQ